jgi:hypothetical protein
VLEVVFMRDFLFALLIIGSLSAVYFWSGLSHLERMDADWKTKIHNAAATGAEITVDGTSYSVYRTPEPISLQAMRSEYSRRCQAITDKFFNEEFKQ